MRNKLMSGELSVEKSAPTRKQTEELNKLLELIVKDVVKKTEKKQEENVYLKAIASYIPLIKFKHEKVEATNELAKKELAKLHDANVSGQAVVYVVAEMPVDEMFMRKTGSYETASRFDLSGQTSVFSIDNCVRKAA